MSSPLDRRSFVRTTVAAGAAAFVVPRVWGAADAPDRIKVGLVGCGGRGTGAAVQALSADKGVVLWAMGDVFPDRLEGSLRNLSSQEYPDRVQVPPERRFTGFTAIDGVLASGVDVVILATPPHFRPAHLAASVAKGVHVFCEKPMCVDVPGYRSVKESIADARAKGLNLMSGFCWRYSAPERLLMEQIRAGRMGDVTGMHSMYLTSPLGTQPRKAEWSDMEFMLRNWQHFNWLSGDHIVEQAVHSIDKINWVMDGKLPLRCTAVGGRGVRENVPERGDVYDHFAVVYEYPGGERCTLTCRQQVNCHNENTDSIMGTRGFAFINGWGPTQWIKGPTPWEYVSETQAPNMYQTEHDELFQAIRGQRPRVDDGNFMAESCLMAIMGRAAAYTGKAVVWEKFLASKEDLRPAAYEFGPVPMPTVKHPGRTPLT